MDSSPHSVLWWMRVRSSHMNREGLDAPDEELPAGSWAELLKSAGAIYDRHHQELYAYAYWQLRDPSESEDMVQEAFLRLFRRRSAAPPTSVRAFLYAVVRNLILDALRNASARRRHRSFVIQSSVEGASAEDPSPTELQRAALAELHRLPDDQRDAVTLKIFGKLTFAKVAEVLSIPEGTVASRYRNAIEKLAERLHVGRGDP